MLDVYIPTVLTDRPYESEDAYLDTYFRLLREDCFHELKVGIQRYLKSELDERDMALYRLVICLCSSVVCTYND